MFPQLPAAVRVFLCTRPTDMRKSFDGLLGMVHEFLGQDPLSGHLFLFLNRRRDRVKILFWEPDGLVIWVPGTPYLILDGCSGSGDTLPNS